MIFDSTILKVCDNSGIKSVKCFKISNMNKNELGCIYQSSIKEAKLKSKLKKGDIVNIILIRSKILINRKNGSFLSFSQNECITLNKKLEFLGSRVFGPLPLELRKMKNLKILSLASRFV